MLGTRTSVWRVLPVTQLAGTRANVEMDTKKLLPPKPVVSERAVILKDWVKYLYVWLIPWSYVWFLESMLRLNHRLKTKTNKKTTWNRLSETCAGRPTVTQKPVFGLVCKTQPRSLTSEISRRKRIVPGWDPRALEQENVKSDTDGRCIMRKLVLNHDCRRAYVFT